MAELTEISASISCRINTGNYEGTEFFVSLKAPVDELDDPIDVQRKLREKAERAMMAQLMRAYKVLGKKLTEQDIAKRHGISYLAGEFA